MTIVPFDTLTELTLQRLIELRGDWPPIPLGIQNTGSSEKQMMHELCYFSDDPYPQDTVSRRWYSDSGNSDSQNPKNPILLYFWDDMPLNIADNSYFYFELCFDCAG